MSEKYIPLYRKYRPQSFLDLVGQEKIAKSLSNAINLDKIAHAYLFCGPRGTGKTSSARILAKSLNCVEGPTISPCGKCPSCVDITNSTPVDVIEIDAASNRSVEDAQNILEKIQYVPIHGKYKIYIIDEVHMLSNTAFNALLKTLEEPPENVVFILATTEAHKVLETIISRCQRFDFRRITVFDIIERLKYISEKENINITQNALSAIAKSAQGGMRDALALLDQLSILDVEKQIDVEDVENLLGKISVEKLFELTNKIIAKNPSDAIITVNGIYDKGNEPLQIITNLIEYFRNLLIIKNCSDKETVLDLTQLSSEVVKKLSSQANELSNEMINYVIDRLSYYLREIKNATDRHLWLEVGIIELCNNLSNVNFSDMLARLERLESGKVYANTQSAIKPAPMAKETPNKVEVKIPEPQKIEEPKQTATESKQMKKVEEITTPEPKITEANTPATKTVEQIKSSSASDTDEVDTSLWQAILANIASVPTRMFFSSLSKPVKINHNSVIIGFAKENFVKQAKDEPRFSHFKAAITGATGNADTEISVKLVSEDFVSPAGSPTNDVKKNSNILEAAKTSPKKTQDAMEEENEEYYEKQLEAVKKPQTQKKDFSDQANMIVELFNGKYMA